MEWILFTYIYPYKNNKPGETMNTRVTKSECNQQKMRIICYVEVALFHIGWVKSNA